MVSLEKSEVIECSESKVALPLSADSPDRTWAMMRLLLVCYYWAILGGKSKQGDVN